MDKANRVLVVQEKNGPITNIWKLPGGLLLWWCWFGGGGGWYCFCDTNFPRGFQIIEISPKNLCKNRNSNPLPHFSFPFLFPFPSPSLPPQGMVDHGEPLAEAAVREVWEETGVKVEFKCVAGMMETSPGPFQVRGRGLFYFYLVFILFIHFFFFFFFFCLYFRQLLFIVCVYVNHYLLKLIFKKGRSKPQRF